MKNDFEFWLVQGKEIKRTESKTTNNRGNNILNREINLSSNDIISVAIRTEYTSIISVFAMIKASGPF